MGFEKHCVKNSNLKHIEETANLQTCSTNIMGVTDPEVRAASCSKALSYCLVSPLSKA